MSPETADLVAGICLTLFLIGSVAGIWLAFSRRDPL